MRVCVMCTCVSGRRMCVCVIWYVCVWTTYARLCDVYVCVWTTYVRLCHMVRVCLDDVCASVSYGTCVSGRRMCVCVIWYLCVWTTYARLCDVYVCVWTTYVRLCHIVRVCLDDVCASV